MHLRTEVSRRPELGWLAACSVMRSKPTASGRADRPYLEQGWLACEKGVRSTHGFRCSCRDAVPLRPFSSDCCASDLSIG